jgi:hypothetical protein
MTLALLLWLVRIQLARALRLTFARMLPALHIGLRRHVATRYVPRRVRARLSERIPRMSLELLRHIVLDAAAVTAVRIAAFVEWLLELFASVLSDVAHELLLALIRSGRRHARAT